MNSKFKPVPQNPEFKIHFKLTQEHLSNWLLSLSQPNSKEACEQIIYLLQLLNKTPLAVKERITFLKIINDYLEQYIAVVKSTCNDPSFPLSAEEQEGIEIITWSYLILAESFYLTAENVSDRDEAVFLLYMALQAMAKAQLHIASIYATPCINFWKLVYKIFTKAEKSYLLRLEINDTHLKDITINSLFAQIIIFHLCDSRQFRPVEMQKIFNFLAKACQNLVFYKLKDLKFQTEVLKIGYLQAVYQATHKFDNLLSELSPHLSQQSGLFMLDLEKDASPQNSEGQLNHLSPACRYFCPQLVADNIYLLIETGNLWSGVLKSMNTHLFSRVARALEPGQKRKYQREKSNKTLLGVLGFDSVISFLHKTSKQTPRPLMKTPEAKPAFSSYEELKHYTDTLKSRKLAIADEHSDFELGYKFRAPDTTNIPIWHDGHPPQTPTTKVYLKKITLHDSSSKGYSVSWDEYGESSTKVGDIFGLVSEDKKRLEIALIRRIAINAGGEYIFGCEILGFTSEIVYLSKADYELGEDHGGEWAIFIPANPQLAQADSIIYSSSKFKLGDAVYLHRSNHQQVFCGLFKELHSGATAFHMELKY